MGKQLHGGNSKLKVLGINFQMLVYLVT
jgi:hypothetical protein